MKIRTDFVTNSSSSSFVAITVIKKDGTKIYGETTMGSGYHEIPMLYFFGDEKDIIKEAIDVSNNGIYLCEILYSSLLDDIHSIHDKLDDIREIKSFDDVSIISIKVEQNGLNGGALNYTYDMEKREGVGALGNVECDFYDDFAEENITAMYDGNGMNSVGDFIIENGVLKSYDGKKAVVTVPNGVIGIGFNAFPYLSNVTEIYLPDSVKFIDRRAFSDCNKLRKIILSSNLECIGARAFENCSSLENIEIPDTVVELGYKCFANSGLKSIKIPKGVTKIKGGLFYSCDSLEDVVLHSGVTTIGEDGFMGCKALKEINIPNGVEKICDAAFWSCQTLEKINLPSTVKEFYAAQVYYCDNLKEISVDNSNPYLTSIDGVLYTHDFKKLIKYPPKKENKEYTVLDGTVYISEYAFEKNEFLESVNLPNTLKVIGTEAFNSCKALKAVDLPNSILSMGENAFRACKSIRKVYAPKDFIFDPYGFFDMWSDDIEIIKK